MRTATFGALACALVLSACSSDDDTTVVESDTTAVETVEVSAEPAASATLAALDTTAAASGSVSFRPVDGGLEVHVQMAGLTPGEHGFHVHENGSCAAGPDGEAGGAAGGHYAPMETPHGSPEDPAARRHAGDFGNLMAGADGTIDTTFTDTVALLDGTTGIVGHAVVVHAGADDLESQPSGDSGGRIACGVIAAAGGAAMPPAAETPAP
jgi:superoxide dismutase, Cu-Zn family